MNHLPPAGELSQWRLAIAREQARTRDQCRTYGPYGVIARTWMLQSNYGRKSARPDVALRFTPTDLPTGESTDWREAISIFRKALGERYILATANPWQQLAVQEIKHFQRRARSRKAKATQDNDGGETV